jgi:hypothetical protein
MQRPAMAIAVTRFNLIVLKIAVDIAAHIRKNFRPVTTSAVALGG